MYVRKLPDLHTEGGVGLLNKMRINMQRNSSISVVSFRYSPGFITLTYLAGLKDINK